MYQVVQLSRGKRIIIGRWHDEEEAEYQRWEHEQEIRHFDRDYEPQVFVEEVDDTGN